MARIGLAKHRKFRQLARALHSSVIARGSLELVWDTGYETLDPVVGTAADVEEVACWRGKRGQLASALKDSTFLDTVVANDGEVLYSIHDFWDHAPDYVVKRAKRQHIGPYATSSPAPHGGQHPPHGGQTADTQQTDGVPCRDGTGRDVSGHRTHTVPPLARRSRIDVAWPTPVPVPGRLHTELRQKEARYFNGDEDAAEKELIRWYAEVDDAWGNKPTGGDDDYAFWRNRYREKRGTTKTPLAAVEKPGPTYRKAADVFAGERL